MKIDLTRRQLGEKIRVRREDRGMRQRHLADALDILPGTLSNIEVGRSPLGVDLAEKIEQELQFGPYELIGPATMLNLRRKPAGQRFLRWLAEQAEHAASLGTPSVETSTNSGSEGGGSEVETQDGGSLTESERAAHEAGVGRGRPSHTEGGSRWHRWARFLRRSPQLVGA